MNVARSWESEEEEEGQGGRQEVNGERRMSFKHFGNENV